MRFQLTPKDRLIIMQFSFPNGNAVPIGLRTLESETLEASEKRREGAKSNPIGTDLLNGNYPQKTNLINLPVSIVRSRFTLVNAVYQRRVDQHQANKTYHMVRFAFARSEFEDLTDERLQKFLPYRGIMLAELQGICTLAFWRVRLFRNPYFNDTGLGQTVISINLEAREPLYEKANPALSMIPDLKPEHEMFLNGNTLCLEKTRLA